MYLSVISKDTSQFPQLVAHMYEHWFIISFNKYVQEKLDIDTGVMGYMGGDTYRNYLFIETLFYTKKIAQLYKNFIANEQLDSGARDLSIRQCAAEERQDWTIMDAQLLRKQLNAISAVDWQYDTQVEPFIYSDVDRSAKSSVVVKAAASKYRAMTILVNLVDGTFKEKALLLRLYIIISDTIGRYIQNKGWYELSTLTPRENKNGFYFLSGVSLPRNKITNAEIRQEFMDKLRSFDVAKHFDYIRDHFDAFGTEQLWKGRIREELHTVNIVASNKYISQLATKERIAQILERVEIHTETVSFAFAKNVQY